MKKAFQTFCSAVWSHHIQRKMDSSSIACCFKRQDGVWGSNVVDVVEFKYSLIKLLPLARAQNMQARWTELSQATLVYQIWSTALWDLLHPLDPLVRDVQSDTQSARPIPPSSAIAVRVFWYCNLHRGTSNLVYQILFNHWRTVLNTCWRRCTDWCLLHPQVSFSTVTMRISRFSCWRPSGPTG